jgi:tetratricopeptide (TPR) repeat protein
VCSSDLTSPDSVAIYDSLKNVAFNLGIAELDMAAKMKPTDPKAYDAKGLLLEREKKYPEAIEEYKKVLKYTGENAKDVSKIAYAYIYIPDWQNAAVWFERLADYEPKNTSALVNLSICYNSLGDYDKSYAVTEKILAIEPDNTQALYNAGQYWFMKMQQAASDLSEITDSTAAGAAKQKELDGQITDYRVKSADYFEKVIAIKPDDKDALRRLGLLYLLSQQNDKAAEVFTKFLALEPNDAGVLDYLGRAYIQTGKFKEAIVPYEKLVENDPGNVEAWERLEELYRYTNQPDKADQAKAKAEELRKL